MSEPRYGEVFLNSDGESRIMIVGPSVGQFTGFFDIIVLRVGMVLGGYYEGSQGHVGGFVFRDENPSKPWTPLKID